MGVFERHSLSNGLRVLTAPMPHAQSVSCFVMLAAGSRYETPETNGIAHFAEHMFFKGTELRPTARDIAGEIDAIGGEFNAFTGKEYTGYYVRCAAETRDTALDVLVDMLRRSKFDPEEIEREKGVIVEEMNMYFDTPRDFIGGVDESLLYGDQPLGWDIIGRKETVRGATRETFLDYVDTWYRPERMVVGIGGRIGDGLEPKLEALLGNLEARETGSPRRSSCPRTARGARAHEAVRPGAPRPRRAQPADHRPGSLRAPAPLDGARRRDVVRLFTEVRERRGLAYYVFGTNHAYTDAGLALRPIGCRHQPDRRRRHDDRRAVPVADERPGPAEELEKARNFAKGRFVLQLESPHGTIMFGLRREVLEGRATEPTEVLAALDAVTAEDIQRVAGGDHGRRFPPRSDRSVRRRRAVREAARLDLLEADLRLGIEEPKEVLRFGRDGAPPRSVDVPDHELVPDQAPHRPTRSVDQDRAPADAAHARERAARPRRDHPAPVGVPEEHVVVLGQEADRCARLRIGPRRLR